MNKISLRRKCNKLIRDSEKYKCNLLICITDGHSGIKVLCLHFYTTEHYSASIQHIWEDHIELAIQWTRPITNVIKIEKRHLLLG